MLGFRISSGSGGRSFDSCDFGFERRGAGVAGRDNDGNADDDDKEGDVDVGEKVEISGGEGGFEDGKEDGKEDSGDDVGGLVRVGSAGNDVVGGGGVANNSERRVDGGLMLLLKRYVDRAANVGSLFTGLREMALEGFSPIIGCDASFGWLGAMPALGPPESCDNGILFWPVGGFIISLLISWSFFKLP